MASSRQDPGYEARIASLMNLCVVRYVTNARTINWRRLTTFAAACEQYLRSVKKKKWRKAVHELLKSRKTLGEYATIVRQMYKDPDGRDFSECLRMSRARFDRLLALVAPLLSKQATNADNTISAGERLCAFLRSPYTGADVTAAPLATNQWLSSSRVVDPAARARGALRPERHSFCFVMASSRQDPGYEARIASLMNLCVVRYVTNARTINWRRLTTFAAACEQYLRSVKKKKWRKAVHELLKSRKTLGEYATIVRQMYKDPDGRDFSECLRMSRARFDRLLALVAPLLSKQATNADNTISAGERLCAFLRYLAHGSSQRIIAESYCHSAAFACANVQETSRALRTVLEHLYMPAPTEELWARNAHQFYDLWNFPNCVGAIDGKHITVEARGSATFNCKKTHSIILLALIDAQYKFVMVDIGDFGSWNDSAVFRSCPIGQNMTSGILQLPEPQELPHTSVKMPFVLARRCWYKPGVRRSWT
ncbi:hypothetical protein ISCGN_031351 [Ixodes scapularis]